MSAPAPQTETLLSLDNVNLTLGGKIILRDVCAKIQNIPGHGQVVGFLGPSGIGKTQLSRVIAGLQEPTSGTVTIGIDNKPVRAGLVGMVPQNYIMFKWATVIQNLLIAGKQGGLSPKDAKDKATSLLERFGLAGDADKYPKALSGGMRQRAAIIRQLMCSEHFIIMDEPFSGLDLIMKARACKLITEIAELDDLNTIIVVTHDVTEAVTISDHIWMLGHEHGSDGYIPGARLVENYDLAAMGLAWQPDIQTKPQFLQFVAELKQRFATLKRF